MNPLVNRHRPVAVTSVLLALASGCFSASEGADDPIWGDWDSRDVISCNDVGQFSEYNTLDIDDDYEGDAVIYSIARLPDGSSDCITSRFDVEVTADGDRYEIEMDCTQTDAVFADCGDLHVELECEIDDDDMDCEGDGVWDEYPFEFERD